MSVNSALLVIDVQLGMFDPGECVHGTEHFLSTLSKLLSRARAGGVPLVYIQHCGSEASGLAEGGPGWRIHPAVSPSEGDLLIRKREPDSFHKTEMHSRLQALGMTRLFVTGIATQFCVNTTVRAAYHLGYKVT
ncbi:MAG: cysteine hydrolase [Candidatus Eiseniibacteriota bacterium]|nr:MAG: cysteine hydrolase [Candidatus Eisenbacteria bacterium]